MGVLRRANRDAIPDAQRHLRQVPPPRGRGVGIGVQAVLKAGLANDAAMGETQRTLMLEE
jgi:hypothetical protein